VVDMAKRTLTAEDKKTRKKEHGYKCVVCGKKFYGGQLQIAHIKGVSTYKKNSRAQDSRINTPPICSLHHTDWDNFLKNTKNKPKTGREFATKFKEFKKIKEKDLKKETKNIIKNEIKKNPGLVKRLLNKSKKRTIQKKKTTKKKKGWRRFF
jgi:hypothetical protein